MSKQQITTSNTKSAHLLSSGIKSNGFIFVSGQVHEMKIIPNRLRCNLLPFVALDALNQELRDCIDRLLT